MSRESLDVRTQIHRRLERDTDIGVVHNLVDPIKDELAKLGGLPPLCMPHLETTIHKVRTESVDELHVLQFLRT